MSFVSTFNETVIETVGGRAYTLPLLTVDDLAAIGRECLHERAVREQEALSLTAVAQKQEIEAYYKALEMDVEELSRQCKTLTGSRRFVARSLRRADPPTDADAFVRQLALERGQRGVVAVAMQVSGLWPAVPKGAAGPNGEGAVPPTDAAGTTAPTVPTTDSLASSSST